MTSPLPPSLRTFPATLFAAAVALGCEPAYVETGDLPTLRERGVLRIVVPRLARADRLPRQGQSIAFERELAERFAESLGLEPRFVRVRARDELIDALLEGRADMIAARLTVTPERSERLAFSAPIGTVREQVVKRVSDTTLRAPADLAGRTIAVRTSSSYWRAAVRLRDEHGARIDSVDERTSTEELLYRVERGDVDLTIADDNLVDQALAYMPGLAPAFEVSGERPVALGVRPDADSLRAALDRFLAAERVNLDAPQRMTGDLPAIRERRVIRMLTRNNAASYFVWRGQVMGFEYDLARRFAERLGVRLQVVVPPTRANLLSWLQQGYGDFVAAGMTRTAEREALNVTFARPYHFVIQTVVARADDDRLEAPADLAGRTLVVRRRSTYWHTAERLRAEGIDVGLVAAPEEIETEEIIDRVAEGDYDLTIADSHILAIDLTWRDDIRAAFTVGDSMPHAWAVRDGDTALRRAIDDFIRAEYRGRWFNITYNKYFRTPHRVMAHATERTVQTGAISPYDELIQRVATEYDFDWRLIAAQMFEESRFDPEAESFAGALGLMQVMPSLGEDMGFDDLTDPEQAVAAGVRYLRTQFELYQGDVGESDRIWFALASYNAGYGHVTDAQRLAAQRGRDPRRWFGEVERVMPLLARAEVHTRTRHGYCRCQEPVNYVRRVRQNYRAYTAALEETGARDQP